MTTSVTKKSNDERSVAFTPFMSQDVITLNAGMVRSFIANPTKSGKIPNDEACIRFIMLCKARRLNPFEGDAFMIGFDDKDGPKFEVVTAHQAFLKRAEANAQYDGMESGVIVESDGVILDRVGDFALETDKVVGGWARVHFKDRSHPMEKRVKLTTFDKGFGRWRIDPAGMIVKCAEADALRSSFPTMLGGMYIEQEMGSQAQASGQYEPISMPRQVTSEPVEPTQDDHSGEDNNPEPRPQSDGDNVIVGPVQAVTSKSGKKKTVDVEGFDDQGNLL
jgi:phage recombination protein Bet